MTIAVDLGSKATKTNKLSFKFEYGFCLRNDNHNLVIFLSYLFQISCIDCFHQTRSSSNTSFVRQMITKMADKMAATYQFAFVDNLPYYLQISYMDYFLSLSNSGFV